jgi:hypothetical protein
VYDMYPWNQPVPPDRPAPSGPAVQALQEALDRRDNGGASPVADDQ